MSNLENEQIKKTIILALTEVESWTKLTKTYTDLSKSAKKLGMDDLRDEYINQASTYAYEVEKVQDKIKSLKSKIK